MESSAGAALDGGSDAVAALSGRAAIAPLTPLTSSDGVQSPPLSAHASPGSRSSGSPGAVGRVVGVVGYARGAPQPSHSDMETSTSSSASASPLRAVPTEDPPRYDAVVRTSVGTEAAYAVPFKNPSRSAPSPEGKKSLSDEVRELPAVQPAQVPLSSRALSETGVVHCDANVVAGKPHLKPSRKHYYTSYESDC